jgi:hypothetical protein
MFQCGNGKEYTQTPKCHDSIWVTIDRFTKVAHFIAVMNDYRVEKLIDLYMDNILRLHGAPMSIVSNRGTGLQHHLPPSDGWSNRKSK